MMEHSEASRLRYLSSNHIEGPLAEGDLDVRDREDKRLGKFDGIIFDPAARQVRYLVVDQRGVFRHKRYLLPVDPTQIDLERRTLHVGVSGSELADNMDFDPRVYPAFSDEDLIEALFPN